MPSVTVRPWAATASPSRFDADGLAAVCVQHEMDHLLGKVFVEYLSPLKRDRIKTKMIKKTRDEQGAMLTPHARRLCRHAGVRRHGAGGAGRAGHEMPLVLTQPDRPAGRGMKLQPSPVKQEALQRGMPVAQPRSLRLDGKYPDDAAAAQAALQAGRPT
jgi:hypothetical protein